MLTPSQWFYSEESANRMTCAYNISLVKGLPTTGLDKIGLAVATIPVCSLEDFMPSGNRAQTNIMIIDNENRILHHPDQGLIGRKAEEAGLSLAGKLSEQSGRFTASLGRKPYSVSYLHSGLTGWTYLSYTSIESLTKQSDKIGLYTLYICLFMLLVSLLLAWLISRRMYSPIQVLMNQIGQRLSDKRGARADEFQLIGEQVSRLFQSKSELEKEVHGHIQQVRSLFLTKLFQGKTKPSELQDSMVKFGYGSQLEGWKTMTAITLQIDSIDNTRYDKRDLDLLLFAICNMIEELIPSERRLAPVATDSTVLVLIGSQENEPNAYSKSVYALTENLQRHIQNYLGLKVSIGMSMPVHSFASLDTAFREGLEALKHRIKLGENIIIQYENINSGKHYLNLNYPKLLETELLDAIKLSEHDKAKELLKQLLRSVFQAELSPQEYQIPLMRLLNNLLIAMQESGISINQIRPEQGSLFGELFELSIASDIEDWFWSRIVNPMVAVFRDRQAAQYQNISEKVIDLVHKHYDADLTLEECASRLHYNANYLSSIFRKETSYTFSEYLTMYRFNVAKKWLVETDMTVKDIVERLRYTNPQNFIRSFRKQEGMTPGQFRSQNGGKEE